MCRVCKRTCEYSIILRLRVAWPFSQTPRSALPLTPRRPSPTFWVMSRMPVMSADLLLEEIGRLRVEHGRVVCGLSLSDVWTHAQETALAAARQKPSDSASESQNLLRGFCRAKAAIEELQALAVRYGKAPQHSRHKQRVSAAPMPAIMDRSCPSELPPPESPKAATFAPLVTAAPRPRTTKGGRFRPLAVEAVRINSRDESICSSMTMWICSDLKRRVQSLLMAAALHLPVALHFIWIVAAVVVLYLMSRPRLVARLGCAAARWTVEFATSSGFEILQELDEFFIVHTTPVVSAVREQLSWRPWKPPRPPLLNSTALLETAVAHAARQQHTTANTSLADLQASALASAAFAIQEMEQAAFDRMDMQTLREPAEQSPSDGSGLLTAAMVIFAVFSGARKVGLS